MIDASNHDSSSLAAAEGDRWLSSARFISREQLPELLEEFRPSLKRIAEKEVPVYLLSRFDSSDVVQETLLRAYRQFDQFAGHSDNEFFGWMRGILLNQVIDAIRHHGRQIRDLSRDCSLPANIECEKSFSASELCHQNEQRERIQSALQSLPEDYRTVIRLRQEQDLSFPEIGRVMGRSTDAARMLWGRAIIVLSKTIVA